MRHVRVVHLLIRLLPFNSGLSLRLRRHLEQCPECRRDLSDVQEARAVTISPHEVGETVGFWPEFARSLERPRLEETAGALPGWGWAVGTAALLALAIAGLFLRPPSPPVGSLSSGVKLRVNYVRMYEQPAQAFIFQTRDVNSTFVWVERPKPGGIR